MTKRKGEIEETKPAEIKDAVAIGGPVPFQTESGMTLEQFVVTLGKRARVAGFVAAVRGREPLRRSADEWRKAMADWLNQPGGK